MSLTEQMSPHGRPRRAGPLLIGVGLVALIAVTVVITVLVTRSGSGGHGTTAATPVSTPKTNRFGIPSPQPSTSGGSTTSAGQETLVLPHPARYDAGGIALGFPHTTAGAVSAAVRWLPHMVPGDKDRQLAALRAIGTEHVTGQVS
ncbi:hypothetical protein [Candidatus Frankia nodulisporulans]|uniref:hypothetical protein n=1 Tax=Candidatus Frankia nodulisporulans TaxID=2060052 RepID=UPI00158297F0|nr:hypothetical protein [Candidatus Frankia nodulisporulans]